MKLLMSAGAVAMALVLSGCGSDCADQYECLVLGQAYADGKIVVKNETKGLSLISASCDQKNGQACHELAQRARAGKKGDNNVDDASIVKNETLSCDYGYGPACYELAGNALESVLKAVKESGYGSVQLADVFSGFYRIIQKEGGVEAVLQARASNIPLKVETAAVDSKDAEAAKTDEASNANGTNGTAVSAKLTDAEKKLDEIIKSHASNVSSMVYYVDKACTAGYGEGCYYLGLFQKATNDPKVADTMSRSCSLGSTDGCAYSGAIAEEAGKPDLALFDKGCAGNNSEACYRAGRLLVKSQDGETVKKGLVFLDKACSINSAWCRSSIRMFTAFNKPDLVNRYATRLCEEKQEAAECGKLSESEYMNRDISRASIHANIGCSLGDANSCAIYSLLFLNNPPQLQALSFKACELGSPLGCEVLSYSLYRDGKSEKAYGTAAALCEQGDADACAIAIRTFADTNKYGTVEKVRSYADKACAMPQDRWKLLTPQICKLYAPKVTANAAKAAKSGSADNKKVNK